MNWLSVPPERCPATTCDAPYQSTPTTLATMMKIVEAVRIARAASRDRAASNAFSTACPNRDPTTRSLTVACSVRIAPRFSCA